eukprot:m.18204 g.18204  ORF g.18204 m.18204 type:complete len:74 (-) comp7718_c0_seq1:30-251(-)
MSKATLPTIRHCKQSFGFSVLAPGISPTRWFISVCWIVPLLLSGCPGGAMSLVCESGLLGVALLQFRLVQTYC